MTRIKTSIGKIPYSLGARLTKPNDKNSEKFNVIIIVTE